MFATSLAFSQAASFSVLNTSSFSLSTVSFDDVSVSDLVSVSDFVVSASVSDSVVDLNDRLDARVFLIGFDAVSFDTDFVGSVFEVISVVVSFVGDGSLVDAFFADVTGCRDAASFNVCEGIFDV